MRSIMLPFAGVALAATMATSVYAQPSPQRQQDKSAQQKAAPAINARQDNKPQQQRKSNSSRHVRACQAKYRSYDSRTDTYRLPGGKSKRCTL